MKRKTPARKKKDAETRKVVKRVLQNVAEKKDWYLWQEYSNQSYFPLTSKSWNVQSFFNAPCEPTKTSNSSTNISRGPTQGPETSQRNGATIKIVRFDIDVNVAPLATMNANGGWCRIVIWHKKNPNGAVLTGPDIFHQADDGGDLRVSKYESSLHILKDWTHQMVSGAAGSHGPQGKYMFSIYPKSTIRWNNTTGAHGGILENDFGYAIASEHSGCCDIHFRVRMVYTDI